MQDRGVQVFDVERVFDGARAEFIGRAVRCSPPLMPPPAIHIVKP